MNNKIIEYIAKCNKIQLNEFAKEIIKRQTILKGIREINLKMLKDNKINN